MKKTKILNIKVKKNKSKYGNKTVNFDGFTFDSIAEYKYYLKLKNMKSKGIIKDFSLQVPFLIMKGFKKNGKKFQDRNYIADFVVTKNDGEIYVVDVKGMKKVTDLFSLKFALFNSLYPYRFIIARLNDDNVTFTEKETLR